jgi:hypothetical protein
MEETAMYSRTILLTAASLAVAGATNATLVNLCQPAVARSLNPSVRVVPAEIDPKDGALMGEILI